MTIRVVLAIWATLLSAQIVSAEDAVYNFPTSINCERQTYQSVPLTLELPPEVKFLAAFNFANVKVATALVDGEIVPAEGTQLLVRRPSFGLVLQTDADKITGTIEIFKPESFCQILAQGVFLRLQNGYDIIGTFKFVAAGGALEPEADARVLTLDRIGRNQYPKLKYFLGTEYAWRRDSLITTAPVFYEKAAFTSLEEKFRCYNHRDNSGCEYQAAHKALFRLVRFMRHFDLQHSTALAEKGSFRLSQMPFQARFQGKCMMLGGAEAADGDLGLCLFPKTGMRLHTEDEFYFPPGELE